MQGFTHKTQRLSVMLLTAILTVSLLNFTVAGQASASGGQCNFNFSDVPQNYWAYSAIQYLYCTGVVSGSDATHFSPNAAATREQFAKVVVLSNGWTLENPATPTFSDVPSGNIFYRFIETAVSHNALSGYADGTFHPRETVTRAQIAKIVVLANGWSGQNPVQPTFTDVPNTNWAYQFIEAAAASDVVSGYSDGSFQPNANVTRAQLSRILYTALAGVPENNDDVTTADTEQDQPENAPDGADGILDSMALGVGRSSGSDPAATKPTSGSSGVVSGLVTDSSTNAPISGTLIILHLANLPCLTDTMRYTSTTASDGSYSLGVDPGSYMLSAYNPMQLYPLTHYGVITITEGANLTANFSLTQGGAIVGTISDATSNTAIAGATAWARQNPISRGFGSLRSDTNGNYRIIVPAGSYYVFGHKFSDQYPRATASDNPYTVAAGTSITANIAMQMGGTISGQVADATSGQPLPCTRVWASYPDDGGFWARVYGWPPTDENGNYRIVVPAGTLRLHARNELLAYPNTPYSDNPITLTVGQVITGADFRLERGGFIVGRVTDATSGQPIPMSRVWAASPDEQRNYQAWPLTNEQGYYRIAVPAGTWKAYAQNWDATYPRTPYSGNPFSVTVGGSITADFALTQGGMIVGQITDSATNQPVRGAETWARPLGGGLSYGWRKSYENGSYRIVVPLGTYRTYARSFDLLYPRTPAEGVQHLTAAGQTVVAPISVTRGGLITGQITDQNSGQPIFDTTVVARLIGGGKSYGDLRTGVNGVYRILAPAGTLRLNAFNIPLHYPSRAYPDNPVTLAQGQVLTASWTLVQW